MISSPFVWSEMWARICWRPSTTRLFTKSRIARVSGAENGRGPRYVIADFDPDEPPQHPQR